MARTLATVAAMLAATCALAQDNWSAQREKWNAPATPRHVYGNTYYVGTEGLASILITSAQGHVLIDGALPESAPIIAGNIVKLGFRVEDVKLIVNSHAHFDHAGGIAALAKRSGATVAASPWSAQVLQSGASAEGDPQFGTLPEIPKVAKVRILRDGETLDVGPIAVTAHFTPGHTPGGTSWSWTSCEGDSCKNLVYADSLSPVSAPGFRFTGRANGVTDFEGSHAAIRALSCDLLLTPHPEFSRRAPVRGACADYVGQMHDRLRARIDEERHK